MTEKEKQYLSKRFDELIKKKIDLQNAKHLIMYIKMGSQNQVTI